MSARNRAQRDLIVFAYGYAASGRDAVARVVQELAQELRSRGERVLVVGMPEVSIVPSGGDLRAKLARLRSEVRFMFSMVNFIARRRREIRTFVSIDVPSGLPFVGALARMLTNGRTQDIAWVMDLYRISQKSGGLGTKLRTRIEIAALRASGSVVTIGSCMGRVIEGVTGRTAEVVPLWHRAVRRTVAVRSGGPLRLLYSGSARNIHPLVTLVRAVAERPDVELSISGMGDEVERVREVLRHLQAPNVSVGRFVADDEIERVYGAADLHVVSLAEEMTGTCVPSKVYAAMAASRGVFYLGSKTGQAALDVLEAGAGVVVSTSDAVSIGRELDALLSDRSLVEKYASAAGAFFDVKRTPHAGAEAWSRVLSVPPLTASTDR
jgi:colanic acid biosynthesis glycosyl transferase WcaI